MTNQKAQGNESQAPRITPSDVEAVIAGEYYFTAENGVRDAIHNQDEITRLTGWHGELRYLTICVLVLQNGHTVLGANHGPVSIENFNEELARQYARENAIDKVWDLLGYELRSKLAETK